MMAHWIQTRSEAEQRNQVLLRGDTTDVNLSSHKTTKGLGPVGRGNTAKGFFVHSVLAVDAKDKQLLGCMGQEPGCRVNQLRRRKAGHSTTRDGASRSFGSRVSNGSAPCLRVRVGDRGSDIFRFWQRCEQLGYDYVTRVAQNRNVLVEEEDEQEDPTAHHLKTLARSLPAQGVVVMTVPAERGRPEGEALVQISWSPVTIQLPTNGTALSITPLSASLVRVWEPELASWRRTIGMDLGHLRDRYHRRGCPGLASHGINGDGSSKISTRFSKRAVCSKTAVCRQWKPCAICLPFSLRQP